MAHNYDNIRLEKGMYASGLTAALESVDPSAEYKGTALDGLDAYQRQLKRFDIKVRGGASDTVEKFFRTSDSSVLFPEYVSRAVRAGMEEANILPEIVATTTRFDGLDYRTLSCEGGMNDKELKRVAEGASIPESVIRVSENTVRLFKRGRMLVSSYEAVKFQRLDLFSVLLRQIGAHIMRQHLDDAVSTIVSGDGNSNPAETFSVGTPPVSGTAGSLSYAALLDFWAQFNPYEMNTILAGTAGTLDILNLEEFKNPQAGFTFQQSGKLVTPIGANLLRTGAVDAPKRIIGLDRRFALEMIVASDISVEYDKLIDRQLERAAITNIAGFAKINNDASKVLSI